jgi:hypothetical protein
MLPSKQSVLLIKSILSTSYDLTWKYLSRNQYYSTVNNGFQKLKGHHINSVCFLWHFLLKEHRDRALNIEEVKLKLFNLKKIEED